VSGTIRLFHCAAQCTFPCICISYMELPFNTLGYTNRGLYSGMGMHLLRSVPNAAVMFLSYELVSAWLDKENSPLDKFELPKIGASNSTLVGTTLMR